MSQVIGQNQRTLISSGFARVNRRRPCAVCMRISAGAVRMNNQGGFIHIHSNGSPAMGLGTQQPANDIKPSINLAPLEARDAVYSELIRLSPAANYDRELVSGLCGLLSRGFLRKEVSKFGALPPEMSERDKLSYRLHRFVKKHFPSLVWQRREVPLIGIPGFWQEHDEQVRLWKKMNYDHPFLIIPYRDAEGLIQACQLRVAGEAADKKKRISFSEQRTIGMGQMNTTINLPGPRVWGPKELAAFFGFSVHWVYKITRSKAPDPPPRCAFHRLRFDTWSSEFQEWILRQLRQPSSH